jgi:hypothetical protein
MKSERFKWTFLNLVFSGLTLGMAPMAFADGISDQLQVTINGVDKSPPALNEGGLIEANQIVTVPKADVPANAVSVGIMWTDPDGSDSDAIAFVKLADGSGLICLSSDLFVGACPGVQYQPKPEPAGLTDLTAALFPNGAGNIKVSVRSDPDGVVVPEPASLILLGTVAILSLGKLRVRSRT